MARRRGNDGGRSGKGRSGKGRSGKVGRPRVPETLVPKPIHEIPLYQLLDAEAVETIHQGSLRILEEVGIDFRDPVALQDWKQAGARVEGERVRFSADLIMDLIAKAPATFRQEARNPERSLTIGGQGMAFAPIYGSPYVRDLSGERRYARLEDFENFARLAYLSPAINHGGGTLCEPTDRPVASRHLDMLYALMRWSDKPFMGSVTAPERAEDSLALCRILFGEAFVENHCVLISLINCNSPLVWDATMLSVLRIYAQAGQASLISPFIMQGANTPVTTAGAFCQLNAEALAGIAYAQLVRPGAPVVYGATLSTVSMKSGAPMYGTAETQHLTFLTGALTRRYGLPMRTGGLRTGAKELDAQAAFESLQTMMPAILAGGHFYLHSAGWLESGLSACFAKFVMDSDQVAVLRRMTEGLGLSKGDLALDTVSEVGPGGHFFATDHTLERYEEAFFAPESAQLTGYDQWQEEGAEPVAERARRLAREALEVYEAPPLDPGLDEALRSYIENRKRELPDDVT